MKRILFLSLLLAACTSQPTDPITPEFEEQHVSPHLGQCHLAFGETQGFGVVGAPCQAN